MRRSETGLGNRRVIFIFPVRRLGNGKGTNEANTSRNTPERVFAWKRNDVVPDPQLRADFLQKRVERLREASVTPGFLFAVRHGI